MVPGPVFTIDFAVPPEISDHLIGADFLSLTLNGVPDDIPPLEFNMDGDTRATVQSFVDACSAN